MLSRLRAIPDLQVLENVSLAEHTRFALGGPAAALVDARTEDALIEAVQTLQESGTPWALIGGGSNMIVSDQGFPGVVLRYTASRISVDGTSVSAEAGAVLQEFVDGTIAAGLKGLETMTGIPGWVGGAIYGNAGAYGRSIHQSVTSVRMFDGTRVREIGNAECEFQYRESVFKRQRCWIVLGATVTLEPADPAELEAAAARILQIRNEKYPRSMRCAGSIFKNLLLAELPDAIRGQVPRAMIREGKVPSAYFLEQVGAKGRAAGGIRVADYHANLLFNAGGGTAAETAAMIRDLKDRVRLAFGLVLEEEVQYLGQFP